METKWKLDASHSDLSFKVKHLMISNVRGSFKTFQAELEGNELENAKIHAVAEVNSIFTNDEKRDQHLRSADFFDAENHPSITFTGSDIKKVGGSDYQLNGEIEIKGVKKPITLKVEGAGKAKDPWGNERLLFSLEGTLNRKDFGLNWNAALETGGVLVGEDIKLTADVQFVKQ